MHGREYCSNRILYKDVHAYAKKRNQKGRCTRKAFDISYLIKSKLSMKIVFSCISEIIALQGRTMPFYREWSLFSPKSKRNSECEPQFIEKQKIMRCSKAPGFCHRKNLLFPIAPEHSSCWFCCRTPRLAVANIISTVRQTCKYIIMNRMLFFRCCAYYTFQY